MRQRIQLKYILFFIALGKYEGNSCSTTGHALHNRKPPLDDSIAASSIILKELTTIIEKTGLSTMLRLLQEKANRISLNEYLLPQFCIQLPASTYDSASEVPRLRETRCYRKDDSTVFVNKRHLGGYKE